jgi:hypothetical protein
MNKLVSINELDGDQIWIMHIKAFRLNYGNRLMWTIILIKDKNIVLDEDLYQWKVNEEISNLKQLSSLNRNVC